MNYLSTKNFASNVSTGKQFLSDAWLRVLRTLHEKWSNVEVFATPGIWASAVWEG